MKAIILPGKYENDLNLLRDLTPEYMLPIVNKPVAEHIVELLSRHNIKDIVMILGHMPYETEKYFEKGARWGVNITYSLEHEGCGLKDSLRHIRSGLNEPFICIYGNCITNLDVISFVNASNENKTGLTMAKQFNSTDDMDYTMPFIMTPGMLPVFLDNDSISENLELLSRQNSCPEFKIDVYESKYDYASICSLNDYREINRRILNGEFEGVLIHEKRKEAGIWIGRHTKIDKTAKLKAPVIIGDYCHISGDVSIESETIIGNSVVIDKNSLLSKSIIFKNSYIGSQTEIIDSVVANKRIINISRKVSAYVKDDFIIGDLSKKTITGRSYRLFNVLTAFLLLILFTPVLLLKLSQNFIFPAKKILYKKKRSGNCTVADLNGATIAKPFKFCFFQSNLHFIHKLPGLINVVKGDLDLVGITPLNEVEIKNFDKDLEALRVNAPFGLFNLWEVELSHIPDLEERIVMDNYYIATRSFYKDIKIVLKSLFLIKSIK